MALTQKLAPYEGLSRLIGDPHISERSDPMTTTFGSAIWQGGIKDGKGAISTKAAR